MKRTLRTKSIGLKVSEEYARPEEAARAGGCALGEWCRQVVLEDASGGETEPPAFRRGPRIAVIASALIISLSVSAQTTGAKST